MPMASRVRLAAALAATLLCSTLLPVDAAPARDSRVSAITVNGTQPVGTFDGVPYTRTYGVVWGVIGEGEDVVGFADLPKNAQGRYEYASEFEIIAPAPGQRANEVVFIDAENRGNAVMLNLLNEAGVQGPPSRAGYSEGVGNGFLQRHATSYAR